MADLAALIPIILLLVCMTGLGWSAAKAGAAAVAAALAVAISVFGYGSDVISLAGPLLEAMFTAGTILLIIFPALAIYELQSRSGAAERIGNWLGSMTGSPTVLALILAWFFALLLEGAAGFGTPVALVAPMLVALGHAPERALLLALIGHAAGVSFGAVGIPMMPLLDAAPLLPRDLALTTMLLHCALGWLLALAVFLLAGTPRKGSDWAAALLAAALFLGPAAALAWLSGPDLPTLGGALIGGGLFILLARWRWPAACQPDIALREGIWLAVLPYVLVLAAILATRLIPSLSSMLQSFTLEWEFGGRFSGSLKPLYHPGLLLLARIMVHSGMVGSLAASSTRLFGEAWPAAVPLVGALGSFITGSATASNILFAEFQVAAAEAAGLAPLLALAGQGFGSAIGNVIAPHNIVAGAATVGLIGREGVVIKTTLPICLAYAGLGGLLLWLLAASG